MGWEEQWDGFVVVVVVVVITLVHILGMIFLTSKFHYEDIIVKYSNVGQAKND